MEKDVVIYVISVVFSILTYYVIVRRKCIILKKLQEKLKIQKETRDNLIFIFKQMIE